MGNAVTFLPWSSAPQTKNKIKRPAPKEDQRQLAWGKRGQPVGMEPGWNYKTNHGGGGGGWPPPKSEHGGGGGGWPPPRSDSGGGGGWPPPKSIHNGEALSPQLLASWVNASAVSQGRQLAALGYLPDLPDWRDFTPTKSAQAGAKAKIIVTSNKSVKLLLRSEKQALPENHRLGDHGELGPVEDQLDIGSCTANAVIGLVEYHLRMHKQGKKDKRDKMENLDMSRMFLYKCTRRLMNVTGDTGAYIRTTIKALRLFGVPPESRWPYRPELLDVEPDPFTFSLAANFKAIKYASLDVPGSEASEVKSRVKRAILDGYPVAFGFTVFKSIETMQNWIIPFPESQSDKSIGGHAVLAVGYDDEVDCGPVAGKGALIIRNSWGPSWGDMGYGYLPYAYIQCGLAQDFWTVYAQDWANMAEDA